MNTKFLIAMLLVSAHALADDSPVGLWKSIDDASGKPKALIRITDSNGELQGKIVKLFRAADKEQNPLCTKCGDARKDQPIIGMTILSGLKKEGEEFTGGQILDPVNGKLYNSTLSLVEGGKKLNVRGYVGAPIFGRTQTWVREE